MRTKSHYILRAELVEAQITTTPNSWFKTKHPTIGSSPIVQIVKPTISKMETVQKNKFCKDSVCSNLEHTYKDQNTKTNLRAERVLSNAEGPVARTEHRRKMVLRVEPVETQITSVQFLKNISNLKKKWLKGGGCPSTGSGTIRLNSIFDRFGNGVFANG